MTLEINKQLLLEDVLMEASGTGAKSTLADVVVTKSASPFFEKGTEKTIEDHVDLIDDKKILDKDNDKKHLKTRMVD